MSDKRHAAGYEIPLKLVSDGAIQRGENSRGEAGSKERRMPIKMETIMAATKAFIAQVTNLPAKIERALSQISGC